MNQGVRTDKLTMRYSKGLTALADLDLCVEPGEIFGLLGPNGAGKTTTFRILTTLLAPTSGSATVGGCDVIRYPVEARRRMGVVAQQVCLDGMLTAYDNLDFYAKIHRVPTSVRESKIREVLVWAGLDGNRKALVDTFSGGMKRKLDLSRVMLLRPQFVLLDEPTTGLDPISRRGVWEMIDSMKEWGCTIVLTTHYMEEADRLCDRLAILHRGRKVAEGTPHQIKLLVGETGCLQIHAPKVTDAILIPLVRDGLISKYALVGNFHERVARLYLDQALSKLPEVLRYLKGQGLEPTSVTFQQPTLDDAFIQLTGQRIQE